MKLAIEESVLRQALDALIYAKIANINIANVAEAITNLKSVIAEMERVEPDVEICIEPDAWATINMCVGEHYGKVRYGKSPIQSMNPLYYTHEKLYSEKSVIGLMKAAWYDGYTDAHPQDRDSIIEECAKVCELGEGQSEYARYYITQIRALKGKK